MRDVMTAITSGLPNAPEWVSWGSLCLPSGTLWIGNPVVGIGEPILTGMPQVLGLYLQLNATLGEIAIARCYCLAAGVRLADTASFETGEPDFSAHSMTLGDPDYLAGVAGDCFDAYLADLRDLVLIGRLRWREDGSVTTPLASVDDSMGCFYTILESAGARVGVKIVFDQDVEEEWVY